MELQGYMFLLSDLIARMYTDLLCLDFLHTHTDSYIDRHIEVMGKLHSFRFVNIAAAPSQLSISIGFVQ